MDKHLTHRLVVSDSLLPSENLAYEEYLVHNTAQDEIVLFLYQNAHTIVMGRHQNPWKEIKVKEFVRSGGKLIRRLSGGGTVYHDKGNLNFSLISNERHFDENRNYDLVLKALKKLDIEAVFSGRNDLTVSGSKFSGSAFYQEMETICHHGTLLVDTDLSTLGNYLTPAKLKIKSKGVDSVRARVMNLSDLVANVCVDQVREALISTFSEGCKDGLITQTCLEAEKIAEYKGKYTSDSWVYGASPDFDMTLSERFAWGTIDLSIVVKEGALKQVHAFTDAMDAGYFKVFNETFKNVHLPLSELKAHLGQFSHLNESLTQDLTGLIEHIGG